VERELGSQAMRTRAVMVANALKRATNRGIRGGTDVEIRLTSASRSFAMICSAVCRFLPILIPPSEHHDSTWARFRESGQKFPRIRGVLG